MMRNFLSAQQREPVVRVKQLDWIEREGVVDTFDASTSIGHYIATITDDNRGMWFIVGQTTGEYLTPDIDAVRAAAQADYEQRIMAAIEIIPAGAGASSDGGAKAGSSPILASEEDKRAGAHGVMPVGTIADAAGCTDAGPSEAIAAVSVGELAGFFVTEFPHLLTMLTQIEVARALLASYRIERLDRFKSGRRS